MRFFAKKMQEKFGGKKKVRIFAARLRNNGKFTDNTERENEVKKIEIKSLYQTKRESIRKVCCGTISRQREE